jgi:tetratricopeptide (TPR) repeat protein
MFKRARLLLEQAGVIFRSLGAHRPIAYHNNNLAELYLETGDLRRAHQLCEQALKEAKPTRDMRIISSILANFGAVLLKMGDTNGAIKNFTEAHDIAINHGLTRKANETLSGLAVCAI